MKIVRPLLYVLASVTLALWLFGPAHPHDDTDPPGGRSGLGVFTDHRTGVQYVSTAWGGLTPRIDREGRPILATEPKETNR